MHGHVSCEVVVGVEYFATIGTCEDAIILVVAVDVVVVDAAIEC